ncbi:MAG: hypothetical protein HRT99_04025 [Mycoplasmatales bacterium]|nr:hypothetical protein [Mycoplasmatales bacterium]
MIKVSRIKKDIILIQDKNASEIKFIQDEIIDFSNGSKGIVMQADNKSAVVGILYNNSSKSLIEGDTAKKTNKKFSISPSKDFLGSIIDYKGDFISNINPKKDKKDLKKGDQTINVDKNDVVMLERKNVDKPFPSGLFGLDILIPFGKGQRSLLVGDKKTGKTSIALSYMRANKDDENAIFIYNAIGKTKSSVYDVAEFLNEQGIAEKSIIVSSFIYNTEVAQYYSPYLATTIAEYFRVNEKKDVFIIYDDLTKHADAYRSISIQMNITPGRESFPGDIFFAHSRLLERSGNFVDDTSISSISICETLEGDIYSYLPTNIISITDGQVVTDMKKFNLNIYPPVDYGASVSRVGRAAQEKILKDAQVDLPFIISNYESLDENFSFGELSDNSQQSSSYKGFILSSVLDQQDGFYDSKIMWILSSLIKDEQFKFLYNKKQLRGLVKIILDKLLNDESFKKALNGIKVDSEHDWDGFKKFLIIELKPTISQYLRTIHHDNPILLEKILVEYNGFNFLDVVIPKTNKSNEENEKSNRKKGKSKSRKNRKKEQKNSSIDNQENEKNLSNNDQANKDQANKDQANKDQANKDQANKDQLDETNSSINDQENPKEDNDEKE